MRLGKIVLKLRAHQGYFKNFIGGAAELGLALDNAPTREFAFVVPLSDDATTNVDEAAVYQTITERFAVVVLLKNDASQAERLGFQAYEKLHDIRNEFFSAILGWQLKENQSTIYYRGGRVLSVNSAWLWYQFEFEAKSIARTYTDAEGNNQRLAGVVEIDWNEGENETPEVWRTIFANWVTAPSTKLPYEDDAGHPRPFPNVTAFPEIGDVSLPDAGDWLDMTKRPEYGAFSRSAWTSAFDDYEGE